MSRSVRAVLFDDDESSLVVPAVRRDWASLTAVVSVVFAFTLAVGLDGTVAGLLVMGVWVGVGTPYAVAIGVILVTALTNAMTPLGVVVLAVGSLGGLVLAPAITAAQPPTYVITVALSAGLLTGVVLVLSAVQLWLAAVVSITVGGGAIYTLHRYEQLQLGLIEAGRAEGQQTDITNEKPGEE